MSMDESLHPKDGVEVWTDIVLPKVSKLAKGNAAANAWSLYSAAIRNQLITDGQRAYSIV